ncbi:cerebellin-1-like [Clupea harengus]|uniref:Cerebellin-1-like n=1 Tax=Clupea harengus TaxID=7950 RepID=A0A6P8G3N4_CLUHA|nr:cerebellin-1-like [Clupea harengus]
MVLELRGELIVTQNELKNTKAEMHKMEADNDVAITEVVHMKSRLSASETEVEKLKMEQAAQESELTAVKNRLAATETEVVNLEKEITEKPKVAFSAGLTDSGFIEAGNTELNLVFTKIITNVGQAYSNETGFFTAPVRGVYYFRFTVLDGLNSRTVSIRMIKNWQQVMYLHEYDTDGHNAYLSSGVTLQLEVGDVVNMQLPEGSRLYDSSSNHSTFSGFLVFVL